MKNFSIRVLLIGSFAVVLAAMLAMEAFAYASPAEIKREISA
ncbi:hypothetical protein [Teichococcus vastitatis]|nr:hypothetical protein [Pseudoroseomonas vastitatis]